MPFFKRKDWRLDRVQPKAPLTLPQPTSERQSDQPPEMQSESAPDLSDQVWDVVDRLVDISR